MGLAFYRTLYGFTGSIFPRIVGNHAIHLFSTPRRKVVRLNNKLIRQSCRRDFSFDGKNIAVYEWGKKEHKPVLLVHGWDSGAADMLNFVPELLGQKNRVIAIDGPAHGASEGKETNIIEFSRVLRILFEKEMAFRAIIAHSFGVGASIIAHEKTHVNADKYVFISSPANYGDVFNEFFRVVNLPEPASKHVLEVVKERFGMYPSDLDVGHKMNEVCHEDAALNRVLLVHDLTDDVVPFANARSIHSRWPDIPMMATRNFGHMRIIKDQRVIAEIVEFINQ